MAETKPVKTRILIISDTHSAPLASNGNPPPFPPFKHPLPTADLLIHCGDLTMAGGLHEYHAALDMIQLIDAPIKLVIAGNHDLSLDQDYIFSHLGDTASDKQQQAVGTIPLTVCYNLNNLTLPRPTIKSRQPKVFGQMKRGELKERG